MKIRLTLALLISLTFSNLFAQQSTDQGQKPITKKFKKELIENLGQVMIEGYVFPAKGEEVAKHLKTRLKAGAYQETADMKALVDLLTKDIQSIIHDVHFNLFHFPSNAGFNWIGPGDSDEAKQAAENQMRAISASHNHGLPKLEILNGNVGYLKMASFNSPVHFVEETVASAMDFLENTKAIIVDVRDNGGGQPEYVNLLQSYFFPPKTLLAMKYNRANDSTERYYSVENISRQNFLEKPLYVLTSAGTGSGAEVFAYAIQSADRGAIIGEKTIGGAHGFSTINIGLQERGNLIVGLPDSRMIDPHTNTNFEGVGVLPDIKTTSDQALSNAYLEAITRLKNATASQDSIASYETIITRIKYEMEQSQGSAANLEEYVGKYGLRSISLTDGKLMLQREGGPKLPLAPVGGDNFLLDIQLSPQPKIEFERKDGKVTGFYLIQGTRKTLNAREQ